MSSQFNFKWLEIRSTSYLFVVLFVTRSSTINSTFLYEHLSCDLYHQVNSMFILKPKSGVRIDPIALIQEWAYLKLTFYGSDTILKPRLYPIWVKITATAIPCWDSTSSDWKDGLDAWRCFQTGFIDEKAETLTPTNPK